MDVVFEGKKALAQAAAARAWLAAREGERADGGESPRPDNESAPRTSGAKARGRGTELEPVPRTPSAKARGREMPLVLEPAPPDRGDAIGEATREHGTGAGAKRREREQTAAARDAKRREREQTARAREAKRRERERAEEDKAQRRQRREAIALHATQTAHAGVAMPDAPGPSGESTHDVGVKAEDVAARVLIEKGYDILERNYRCKLGELDIVAEHDGVLVFVEVRSRANDEHGDAVETVGPRKRRQVARVAEVYLAHRRPPHEECRFDVVAINGPDAIDVYDDAWRLGGIL